MAGKCTVVGKDNKEDKTKEEADMTLSPFFPKVYKAIYNLDLDHSRTLLNTFGPLMKILEKLG